ncbi:MAG: ArgP/LysG family DNA-binding transcriptional regulator, partial [Gammaproteobacteria bacterium]
GLDARQTHLRITLAVNNDTLSTWLLKGLTDFLRAQQILLDIVLDDQDHTFTRLAAGEAVAGVSSEPTPMRGCQVTLLGVMRYRFVAAQAFVARWFPDGLQRAAARQAPLLVFDRKDALQSTFLQRELGLPTGSYPCHYIPATEAFLQAVRLGLGYGMVPEQQLGDLVATGELIDLAPSKPSEVPLYWHAWKVQSAKMEQLSEQVIAAARAALSPVGTD